MSDFSLYLPRDHWQEHGLLIAVSGGADSTALLRALVDEVDDSVTCGQCLAVGHVNHGLRGAESDDDAIFVQNLAASFGLRYFEHRIQQEEWSQDKTGSVEAAARNIRYDFLARTAHSLGFRYIATAHTADDQTETVLHRLLRGTGLTGLAGIARFRRWDDAVTIWRPLLHVRRQQIIEYLNEKGQTWRSDSSNAENDFTRNRIRNKILPELRQDFNPQVDRALCRLAALAKDHETVLGEMADALLEKWSRKNGEATEFDTPHLKQFSAATLREFFHRTWIKNAWPLRDMGFDDWNRLVQFFLEGQGRQEFPGRITALHENQRFVLIYVE